MPVTVGKYRVQKERVIYLEKALKAALGEDEDEGTPKLKRSVSGADADKSFRRSMRKLEGKEIRSVSAEHKAKAEKLGDVELRKKETEFQDLIKERDQLGKHVAELTRSWEKSTKRVTTLENENRQLTSNLHRERKQATDEQNRLTQDQKKLHQKADSLLGEIGKWSQEVNTLKKKLAEEQSRSEKDLRELKKQLKFSKQDTVEEKKKSEADRQRSNKLLEMRISQDSSFSNLNDPSRLEVVLQAYKDLENGQRLDALDELEKDYEEDELLQLPSQVFMRCFTEAQEIKKRIESKIYTILNEHAGDENNQGLKETTCLELSREVLAKAPGSPTPADITQVVAEEFGLKNKGAEVMKFVDECGRLSWLFVLQPTHVRPHVAEPGSDADEKAFKLQAESVRGSPVVTTVWPALVKTLGSLTASFSGTDVLHKGSILTRHPGKKETKPAKETKATGTDNKQGTVKPDRPLSMATSDLKRKHAENYDQAPQDADPGSREPEKISSKPQQVRQIQVASAGPSSEPQVSWQQDQPGVNRNLITNADGKTQPPSKMLRMSSSGTTRVATPPSGNARSEGQANQQPKRPEDQVVQDAASHRQPPVAAARGNQSKREERDGHPAKEMKAIAGRTIKIEVQQHGGSAPTRNAGAQGSGQKMTHAHASSPREETNL